MAMPRTFPQRVTLGRPKQSALDVLIGAAVIVALYSLIRVGRGATLTIVPGSTQISTRAIDLPYYAARSLLRMFIALAASTAFSLGYGYAAARSRRLEKVLLPLLDILQSVPVLGFLVVIVSFFLSLFPNSYVGVELASIFAIFTAQAWNMTFSFYHSLITLPHEFDELSRNLRLTRWMRFWKIEVPAGAIGLVWNGMMSMAGAWFFLSASEAISSNGHSYPLPGVGSYAAAAIARGDLRGVGLAIATMAVLVIGVNFFFWRPLTAWAERFKMEQSESADRQRSVLLEMLQQSRWPQLAGRARRKVAGSLGRAMAVLGRDDEPLAAAAPGGRAADVAFVVLVGAVTAFGLWRLVSYTVSHSGLGVYATALGLGFLTFLRVAFLVAVSTLIWVPVGVRIGESPRLARTAQPVVQVLASFPANFLFPFATLLFIHTGISLNFGAVLLMALGSQWYILFNTIAGAMAIPTDLREAMDNLRVTGWQRWKRLIIPGIFPFYVTGAITASGGAWNASIVAEIVTFRDKTLVAKGLGAYIAQAFSATDPGHVARVLAGVAVMSLYVVGVNRLVWRPLYGLAERRYKLD
ncbi:MAG: NitT/TauT family transport system permease protein [Actinomycetota bacterium]|nr:NitT/TauT family transport system permease protein [Actinomycetota bacterium]